MVTGVYPVTSGDVVFNGQSLNGKKTFEIIDGGIARTFQNIRLFSNMTVLEHILVGHHSRMKTGLLGSLLHTASMKKEEAEAVEEAHKLLQYVGLDDVADHLATELPTASRESWRSPAPWPPIRRSSCWMNRRPA